MQHLTPVKFLIVDDDAVDVMAIQRTMKKLKLANPVLVARNGIEALEILRGEADREQIMPPFIVTLDLNMPRMGGEEFLENLRKDEALKSVVVFVWSTSDARSDVDASYDRNVAGYIVKEQGQETFTRALSMLEEYSQVVVLPNHTQRVMQARAV